MSDEHNERLRAAYTAAAEARDAREIQPWKLAERAAFAARLREAGCRTLLEIGAGTGLDSLWFQAQGFEVTAIDLTPEMVDYCRRKGLDAHVMDVCDLGFPDTSFDAAYSLNTLLHLPRARLPVALAEIRRVLVPGGLVFLGLYGGPDQEGILESDSYEPKRFFASHSDASLRSAVEAHLEIVSFRHVPIGLEDIWFQAVTARRP